MGPTPRLASILTNRITRRHPNRKVTYNTNARHIPRLRNSSRINEHQRRRSQSFHDNVTRLPPSLTRHRSRHSTNRRFNHTNLSLASLTNSNIRRSSTTYSSLRHQRNERIHQNRAISMRPIISRRQKRSPKGNQKYRRD